MRDAAPPPHHGREPVPAPASPHQRAAAIRSAANDVLTRVNTWRNGPDWHDEELNRRRYQVTVDAVAALNALPDPDTHDGITELANAVRPILTEWRPSRPGPEQPIYAAAERLQRVART